jgi:hypothetical protein
MPLNLDKYRPYLDGFDLTDEQKTAMIEALWAIAESVTDLAYGVHSTQLIDVANDNYSLCKISVIEFFQLAANDPVLDELADDLRRLEADNDNNQNDPRKEAQKP